MTQSKYSKHSLDRTGQGTYHGVFTMEDHITIYHGVVYICSILDRFVNKKNT